MTPTKPPPVPDHPRPPRFLPPAPDRPQSLTTTSNPLSPRAAAGQSGDREDAKLRLDGLTTSPGLRIAGIEHCLAFTVGSAIQDHDLRVGVGSIGVGEAQERLVQVGPRRLRPLTGRPRVQGPWLRGRDGASVDRDGRETARPRCVDPDRDHDLGSLGVPARLHFRS